MYGDPDPDAELVQAGAGNHPGDLPGSPPLVRYTGDIQRYQNRLLVQYLKGASSACAGIERLGTDLVAVVDAQRIRRQDPPNAHVVIDHHPRMDSTTGIYVDLRETYGSTCSILAERLAGPVPDLADSPPRCCTDSRPTPRI